MFGWRKGELPRYCTFLGPWKCNWPMASSSRPASLACSSHPSDLWTVGLLSEVEADLQCRTCSHHYPGRSISTRRISWQGSPGTICQSCDLNKTYNILTIGMKVTALTFWISLLIFHPNIISMVETFQLQLCVSKGDWRKEIMSIGQNGQNRVCFCGIHGFSSEIVKSLIKNTNLSSLIFSDSYYFWI